MAYSSMESHKILNIAHLLKNNRRKNKILPEIQLSQKLSAVEMGVIIGGNGLT